MNSQVAQPAKRQPKGFQAPERKRVFRTKAWREKSLNRGEKWRKRKKRVAKWGSPPISRVLSSGPVRKPARRAIIPLVDALPRRSSSLPGDSASSLNVPLFGLAPDGVYRAVTVTSAAVGSYPTVSPLPDLRRAIGGLLSVALSVAFTRRLWRPAVSRHPALRGPDFPRYANVTRLPGELPGAQYNGFAPSVPGRRRRSRRPASRPAAPDVQM